jgi:hypothetical protein
MLGTRRYDRLAGLVMSDRRSRASCHRDLRAIVGVW